MTETSGESVGGVECGGRKKGRVCRKGFQRGSDYNWRKYTHKKFIGEAMSVSENGRGI